VNPRKLGQVGDRQTQLNRESRPLAQRLAQQLRLSAGDREQMQRMAEEQARIRQQLEEIRRDDETKRELLGKLDQAEREMKDVEEALRSGASDGLLEQKQQRILSRLLDAQRSVNRRDFDPEREARPGEDIERTGPAELPADLLRQNDRLRHDLLKAESDRYPAQYRAFVEAYLRSLNGSAR
jgi:septal ring factor EnvC (AmiA/AmiB activator)